MSRKPWQVIFLAVTLVVGAAGPVLAHPSYFAANCGGCHTNDSQTCIGCHHHAAPTGAITNKTQYAPGETITVTLTGPTDKNGWARALLYNQSNAEVARVTGPTGMGDDGTGAANLHYPFTLSAPAPTVPGTYTWQAAWWGSPYDTGNPTAYPHGPEIRRSTNSFTVAVPTVTGTVLINAGAAATNAAAVTLALTVAGAGVTQMRFSNDNAAWSAWQANAASAAWTLAAGDGAKTVYVQWGNAAGTVLGNAGDSITLDTAAPTGSVLINSGAAYANTVNVSLALSAADGGSGVSLMRFSNDNVTWSAWEAYAATKAWALAGGDGAKTVRAQFRDAAGNLSAAATDGITLDTAAPTGSILINSGAASTASPAVTLTLAATDGGSGVAQMQFSNDGLTWSGWETFAPAKAWVLSAGTGTKTVYAQFRDNAGNVSANYSATITLNASQPTGTVTINSGAAFTNSTTVNLALSVFGVAPTQMQFSNDNLFWSPWEPNAATKAWTLNAADGTKTVYVQWGDTSGTVLLNANASIQLDQAGPSGSIQINGGAFYTTSTAVVLTLTASDGGSGVARMQFSTDGLTWGAWETYAPTRPWTLVSGNGARNVYVQFQDALGNVSPAYRGRIVLDATPPTGSIVIAAGAPYTALPDVNLTLLASDPQSGVSDMRFSTNGASWSAWEPYAIYKAWTLAAGDGLHAIHVQYRDAAGNLSISYRNTIILDTTSPTGSILINSGATACSTTAVTLTLSAADAATSVAQMRFSNDGVTWAPWELYATTRPWILIAGDGLKTLYVQFNDAPGNVSAIFSSSIVLNSNNGPTGTLVINGDRPFTTSTAVTLTLSVSGPALTQLRLSNDEATWTAWGPFEATKAWTLAAGEGIKTVTAQFGDPSSVVLALARDQITFDATAPTGGIQINGGASSTTSTAVTLTLAATDGGSGVARMRFSNGGTAWSAWETYATGKAWSLTPGNGNKAVSVQFSDNAGNVSASFTANITLNATPPTGAVTINGGAALTNSLTVQFALTVTDPAGSISQMRFGDNGTTWTAWEPFAATRAWTLPPGDGPKTVYVRFGDSAGRVLAATSGTITLDRTAPTGSVTINSGAVYATTTPVRLALAATDARSGVAKMRLSSDNLTWGAWEAFAATRAWVLAAGDGSKNVYVQFMDGAGNPSGSHQAGIVLDTIPPTGTIRINNGNARTSSTTVILSLSATDTLSGVSRMRFSNGGGVWSAWQPYATQATWIIPPVSGIEAVQVQFADVAGNVSQGYGASITYGAGPTGVRQWVRYR